MNIVKKLRCFIKEDKRGMTLIEIIVVLVILAILAAFMVPTMLGFVKEAQGKAYIAEARTCYIAAQTISTEESAFGTADDDIEKEIAVGKTRFEGLIGPEIVTDLTSVTATVTNGAVEELVFVKGGKTITIKPGHEASVQ